MEENQPSAARQFFDKVGAEAVRFNRKVGYDTGLNRQRVAEQCRSGMSMLHRLLPAEGATVRDLLQFSAKRFAALKTTVDAAEKETPSIARFEKVIRVMGATILDAAKTRDHLFELSGAFRRGFDILAERPKQPKKVTSSDDFLFTARERTRITKAILAFYEIIVSCGHDCYTTADILPDQKLPERIERVISRYRPDKSAPVSPETRELIVGDTYFTFIKDGLWSYDGDFFRFIKRYFGAVNSDCIDPEDLLEHAPEGLLDFTLADLIASPEGRAMGMSILSAMASGDGSPEMAAARADDVGEEIVHKVLRDDWAKSCAQMAASREECLKILKEAEELRRILTSDEEIQLRREAPDPEKEEAKRLDLLKKVEDNIRLVHENLKLLDREESMRNEVSDAIPPPRDLALFKPVVAPAVRAPAAPSAAPKRWSKFAGQTLKRKDGAWIRVEKDGVTLTCPTRMGDEVKPRSYTLPNAAQVEFLEPLLARFESGEWYKPAVNKAKWQGTCFKRGDAKQFHDDGHIALWQGEEGGCRGAIRLAVAKAGT